MKPRFLGVCTIGVVLLCYGQTSADVTQVVGAIASLDQAARKIVVKADAGGQFTVQCDSKSVFLRITNGVTDMSKAEKLAFDDLGVSDRVFVRR